MKKFIDTVTITGADSLINPYHLVEISKKYPHVEWAILLSASKAGTTRYPSRSWLDVLRVIWADHPNLRFSGHICGTWVRDICDGKWTILDELGPLFDMFSRVQLNFSPYVNKIFCNPFIDSFDREELYYRQFIFQLKTPSHYLVNIAQDNDIDAVPLFDISGGTGVVPEEWLANDQYMGFAGGLNPENLAEEIEKIANTATQKAWIDVESGVRTNDWFDLDKVNQFLKIASDYVCEYDVAGKHVTSVANSSS